MYRTYFALTALNAFIKVHSNMLQLGLGRCLGQ